MARITLGEDVFGSPGLALLVARLGCSKAAAVGALALLWYETRRAGFVEGSAADIHPFLPGDVRHRDAVFRALVDAGFIIPTDAGFAILGNAEHVRLIERRREAGRRGRAKTNLVAKERLQARSKALAPAGKGKLKPKASRLKQPTAAQRANAAAWEAYAAAFLARWGVEPIRNARVNACVAQFVKRVGADAPEVLRFYLAHNDMLYLRSSHALTLAVRDAEGLHAQWQRGQAITTQDIRRLEHAGGVADQLRRIGAGEL